MCDYRNEDCRMSRKNSAMNSVMEVLIIIFKYLWVDVSSFYVGFILCFVARHMTVKHCCF